MKQQIFFHNVYFWLKQPKNTEHCNTFETALKKFLSSSENTRTSSIAKPANTDRPVVDNSYTYSLLVSFNSKKQHDLYQAEAAHKEFLDTASNLWDKVQIFDSEEI